ncbi:hypothetical protein [Absidia glauca]|uniref:Uncharacterized protein n=1 Tax=Absidia glauca TaxID=4829 RepID=A0A163M007_ABSGL|nr:hypothetical protein [Absidia glauca]
MSQTKKRRRLINQAVLVNPEFASLYHDEQASLTPPATIRMDPAPILTLGSQQAQHSKPKKALASTNQHALIERLNKIDNNSTQSEINKQQGTSSTMLDLQSFQLMPFALEAKLSKRDLLSPRRTSSIETQQPLSSLVFSDHEADTSGQIDPVSPISRAIPAAPPSNVDPNDSVGETDPAAHFYEVSTNHTQDDMATSDDESDLLPPSPTIACTNELPTTPPHDIHSELNATPIIDETAMNPDQGQTFCNGTLSSVIIDEGRRPHLSTSPSIAPPSPPPLETVPIHPSTRIQAMFAKRQPHKSKLPMPTWEVVELSAPTDLSPPSRNRKTKTVKLSKREASRLPKPSTLSKKRPTWTETTLYPS